MEWNDCIVFIMAKSYQKLQGEFKKLLEPYGLTTLQFLTIALLSKENDLSAADICERLLIDKSTLSGVLERLEEKGLIVKRPDQNDRRALSISMSGSCLNIVEQLSQIPETINEIAMKSMSSEERLLLKRLLKDICV